MKEYLIHSYLLFKNLLFSIFFTGLMTLEVFENVKSYSILKNHPSVGKIMYFTYGKNDQLFVNIILPKHVDVNEQVLDYRVDEIYIPLGRISTELKNVLKLKRVGRGGSRTSIKFLKITIRRLIEIIDKNNKGSKVVIEEFKQFVYDPEEDRKIKFRLDKQLRDHPIDLSVTTIKQQISIKLYDCVKINEKP